MRDNDAKKSLYYAITLTADESGSIEFGVQTHWVGYADSEHRIELREPSKVNRTFTKIWEAVDQSFIVVETTGQMEKFLIEGGNAIVQCELAESIFDELLNAAECMCTGAVGYADPDLLSSNALRRTPTPRLRMEVLVRDKHKCRICGRSPDNHLDLELHIHHIRPWSKGGITDPSNLITLCNTCHRGLDPHYDRSLFRYLEARSTSDNRQHKNLQHLRGIANYRANSILRENHNS